MTKLGQNRLGVKLDTFYRIVAVPEAHDLVNLAALQFSPGRDFQAIRQRHAIDDQGMIARRGKRRGEILENTFPLMMNRRGLAMHDTARFNDITAEHLADTLVSKANAQERILPLNASITAMETPASFGVQGPGDITISSGARASISSTVI